MCSGHMFSFLFAKELGTYSYTIDTDTKETSCAARLMSNLKKI